MSVSAGVSETRGKTRAKRAKAARGQSVEKKTRASVTRKGRSAKTTKRAQSKAEPVAKPRASAKRVAVELDSPGQLPILYMLSPQKFMSPFDCNMAVDSGYTVVLPYDNVSVSEVGSLVQDAIFSRPPSANTGIFLAGKDIKTTLEMCAAAQAAMVPNFEVSVFADPGGSFTTAAAMMACTERILQHSFKRGFEGLTVSIFGATGVVGFATAVLAAIEGAHVRVVAHDTLAQIEEGVGLAKDKFGVTLEAVEGQTAKLKRSLVGTSDVVFTAGPAGVNILSRQQIARSRRLLIAADVNAVAPSGVEGMELFMDGVPLPGASALGLGALAIGDIKYKTQAGLFQKMIATKTALNLDFRDAFQFARELVAERSKRRRVAA